MTRCTLPCLALALVGVAGCSLDFDGLDPRLSGSGGQSSTTGVGGSTSSNGGNGGVAGTSGKGGAGGEGGVVATGGMGGSGGEGGSGSAVEDCIQKYGAAPGFVLCTASADSCSFNATTGIGGSCLTLCLSLGGMCIGGFNNGADRCVEGGMIGCSGASNSSDICVCSQ